ncbi:hypothetical protein D3C73_1629230 [compost metagenome]
MVADYGLDCFNDLLHTALDRSGFMAPKRNNQGKLVLGREFHAEDLGVRTGQAYVAENFLQQMALMPGLAAWHGIIP